MAVYLLQAHKTHRLKIKGLKHQTTTTTINKYYAPVNWAQEGKCILVLLISLFEYQLTNYRSYRCIGFITVTYLECKMRSSKITCKFTYTFKYFNSVEKHFTSFRYWFNNSVSLHCGFALSVFAVYTINKILSGSSCFPFKNINYLGIVYTEVSRRICQLCL